LHAKKIQQAAVVGEASTFAETMQMLNDVKDGDR
jgi:hypothetical protein